MKTYKCIRCKQQMGRGSFYKDMTRPNRDFTHPKCKDCCRIEYRERRQKKKETFLRKEKKYYLKHKKEIVEKRNVWYHKNKDKASAHNAVKVALYKGLLVRKPCEVCGSIKSQAHHPDYSKPLEVKWLCILHHMREHAK